MEPAVVVDIGRNALTVTLMLAGPMLGIGLGLGLMVGIFQAVTQINEATLTFIPKFLGITLILLFLMPWMMMILMEFTLELFDLIARVGLSS
jgi:flagellar biosynthetic protein FliQ